MPPSWAMPRTISVGVGGVCDVERDDVGVVQLMRRVQVRRERRKETSDLMEQKCWRD
jgi:hypothetical protein